MRDSNPNVADELKNRIVRFVDIILDGERAGCWEWRGHKDRDGYGTLRLHGSTKKAHRVSYGAFVGQIPVSMHVLHKCDNPGCCNPEHLRLGTNADNQADKNAKGRAAAGARHGSAKLTEHEVSEIRRRYDGGGVTQKALADEFRVHKTNIQNIVRGHTWRTALRGK